MSFLPHVVLSILLLLLLLVDFLLTRRRNRMQLKLAEDKLELESVFPKRNITRAFRLAPMKLLQQSHKTAQHLLGLYLLQRSYLLSFEKKKIFFFLTSRFIYLLISFGSFHLFHSHTCYICYSSDASKVHAR